MSIHLGYLKDYVTENFIWQMALKIQKKQSLLSKFSLKRFVDAVPGKKWFGLYRFMPFCFLFGAGMEWTMIHWTVGETNFCKFLRFTYIIFLSG